MEKRLAGRETNIVRGYAGAVAVLAPDPVEFTVIDASMSLREFHIGAHLVPSERGSAHSSGV